MFRKCSGNIIQTLEAVPIALKFNQTAFIQIFLSQFIAQKAPNL